MGASPEALRPAYQLDAPWAEDDVIAVGRMVVAVTKPPHSHVLHVLCHDAHVYLLIAQQEGAFPTVVTHRRLFRVR
jgi:hypothetical protein